MQTTIPNAGMSPIRSLIGDKRFKNNIFTSIGHNQVRSHPVLSPSANQIYGNVGYGLENAKGFSARAYVVYDYRLGDPATHAVAVFLQHGLLRL